jgi:uracil-DNA glycosylase family 4
VLILEGGNPVRKNEYGRLEMHPLPPVEQAKVVLIGEFPNVQELREGRYFISSGADALRATLDKCGINARDCYNTVAVPYLMSKVNKNIPAERFPRERQRVISEIKESGATLVMPLGTMATSLLLGSKSLTVTKVLGNVLDIPELPGVKIIPNYHPALLLHSPGNYKVFQNVIQTMAQFYKGVSVNPGVTKWHWVDTAHDLRVLAQKVNELPYIGADIETSSLNTKEAMVWVMGVAVSKNEVYVIPREMFITFPNLIRDLFSTECAWIWHHGKYDTSLLHWKGFDEARLDEDTIYLHYCLNETNGTHGLGVCATVYLGADEYKSKMNSEFAHIDTEEAYKQYKQDLAERVATDADYTLQLYEVFRP